MTNNELSISLRDSWPHPRNPNIKVTNSPEIFQALIKDTERDGVILKRPAEAINQIRPAVNRAISLLEDGCFIYPYSVGIQTNQRENIFDLLPKEFGSINIELRKMFHTCALGPVSALTFIATDDARFLRSLTPKHPVLATQWQIPSHKGDLSNEEGLTLQSGDWAYFQPGAKLDFSENDAKRSFLTVLISPYGKSPGTEPT